MTNNEPQQALLWIRSAHQAIDATTELLTAISPHWDVVKNTGYCVDLMYNDPGYSRADEAAKAAWLRPALGQLERDLAKEADDLAEMPSAAEDAALYALPRASLDYDFLSESHQAACQASAIARRPSMKLTGEYLYLDDGCGPDLIIRNQNPATLQAMLRAYWQPVARGEASEYAMAPASHADGGLAPWLRRLAKQSNQASLLNQYLSDRNTDAALGLDIFCVDNLPDWDCPMGVLMLFATPSLAHLHIQRLQRDTRVHWWPDLATADAHWRQPDWPPNQRVQLCPFDLRRDKIWDGNQQVFLLP